jgi:polysaccharide chain length determinant protein (PEP-CTERM system associated)
VLPGKKYTAEEVAKIAWTKKWLILLPFFVITAGTALVAHFLPNKYRSDTLMLVVPQRIPENIVRPTVTGRIEDRLNSISQQIMSRTRLERIILDNNLYATERRTGIMQDIVEQMRRDINIDVIKGDAFRISYVGNDPRTVMTVTDRLASLFIEENVNERAQLAEGTSRFLQTQVENARARLAEQEAKLEEYRKQYSGQLPSQADANMQVIQNTQLQIQSLLQSLNRDRDRKLIVQSMLADLLLPDNQSVQMPEMAGAPAAALSPGEQLVLARARLRQMEGQLTPAHPDIIAARRQVSELEKRVEAEAISSPMSPDAGPATTPSQAARRSRIKALQLELESLDRQIASQQAQERQLRATAAAYQARLELVPARETELAELTRDYTTLNEIYADLLQKSEAAKIATTVERGQIGEQFKLLDPARMPEKPFSPNRQLIDLTGAAVGLMAGLLLVAFQEYRDTSFKTEDDVIRLLSLPVLARIPLMVSAGDQHKSLRRRMMMSGAGLVVVCAGATVVWKLRMLHDLFR